MRLRRPGSSRGPKRSRAPRFFEEDSMESASTRNDHGTSWSTKYTKGRITKQRSIHNDNGFFETLVVLIAWPSSDEVFVAIETRRLVLVEALLVPWCRLTPPDLRRRCDNDTDTDTDTDTGGYLRARKRISDAHDEGSPIRIRLVQRRARLSLQGGQRNGLAHRYSPRA